MSKELEALNKIRQKLIDECNYILYKHPDAFIECNNDIKKYVDVNYISDIEKSLKALEIIKYKQVSIRALEQCFKNNCQYAGLTLEEYDLLKEVLL